MVEQIGQRNARFASSDLVVALEHVDLVVETLRGFGVGLEEVERSDDLDLALLRLANDEDAAKRLEDALEELRKPPATETVPDPDPRDPITNLDRFLKALRKYLALRYAGWTPTLGKNRLVGRVEGGGQIGHSGESDPKPSGWRPAARVASGPGLGVRVGVLDTAVFPHPDFDGRWIGTPADVLQGKFTSAVAGHGTFVTGLVLRKAPGCTVQVRKALSTEDATAESWEVAKKIVELGRTGLDVLNLSMVCYTEDGQPPLVLATAIDRLDPDTVVVAAAGNHGNLDEEKFPGQRNKPAWPAALDDVIAVGAAKDDGELAEFTPTDAPWIDAVANGVGISSTFLTGRFNAAVNGGPPNEVYFPGYAEWSGSSFAAALVSGAIAAWTVPGRTPARAAWKELRDRAEKESVEQTAPRRRPLFLRVLP
jgi:hypothetical protein